MEAANNKIRLRTPLRVRRRGLVIIARFFLIVFIGSVISHPYDDTKTDFYVFTVERAERLVKMPKVTVEQRLTFE
jgi:hypothetical protein